MGNDTVSGFEITVAIRVTGSGLYGRIRSLAFSLMNLLGVERRIGAIIANTTGERYPFRVLKSVGCGCADPELNFGIAGRCLRITLDGISAMTAERIASGLCRDFHQESALIRDVGAGSYKLWRA